MKIIDAHIDLSDNILYAGKNFFGSPPTFPCQNKLTLCNQVDFQRLLATQVKIFFGSVCPFIWKSGTIIEPKNFLKETLKHVSVYLEIIKKSQGKLVLLTKKQDLNKVIYSNSIGVLLHLEGLYFIKKESDLFLIDILHSLGFRSIGLFWEKDSPLGTGGRRKQPSKGLTPLGKKVVSYLDEHNFIIDLTHASDPSIEDILALRPKLLIFSHGHAGRIAPKSKGLNDKQIRAITDVGGVIGVNFLAPSSGTNHSIVGIVKQIKYLIKIGGLDHVGLGSDFDGLPPGYVTRGLEDITKVKNIALLLKKENFSQQEITKILFNNFLKVIKSSLM